MNIKKRLKVSDETLEQRKAADPTFVSKQVLVIERKQIAALLLYLPCRVTWGFVGYSSHEMNCLYSSSLLNSLFLRLVPSTNVLLMMIQLGRLGETTTVKQFCSLWS
jgi:hypothetical protein